MPSLLTLQQIVNIGTVHADLMPFVSVGGFNQEPALSLCNDVLQELLAGPLAWKWNRKELGLLVTSMNKQDYQFGGAAAWTVNGGVGIALATASTPGITESVNTVTVTTLEPHNFNVGDTVWMNGNTVAAYNSAFTQTPSGSSWGTGWVITAVPTTTSFTFTHAQSGLGNSGAPGITDFGWLESASMVDINSGASPQPVHELLGARELQPSSDVRNPERVCVLVDNLDGTLKIRFRHVPGSSVFGVTLVYQKKAPIKTDLGNTWSPVPDELSFALRQMFLARAYRFADQEARANVEYQRAQIALMKAQGHEDSEQSDEHIIPDNSLMGGGISWW